MGAAVSEAMGERQVTIAGLAAISLEEYAACLEMQLAECAGVALSAQLVHRLEARRVLQDAADASQARFGELEGPGPRASAVFRAVGALVTGGAPVHALALVARPQRLAHVQAAVLRVVCELTSAPSTLLAAETPLM